MSDFSAARREHGESHPSKFRIVRSKSEAEYHPSPENLMTKGFGIEQKDYAAEIPVEKKPASEDSPGLLPAPQVEENRDSVLVKERELAQGLLSSSSTYPLKSALLEHETKKSKQPQPPPPPQSSITRRNPIPPPMPPPTGPIRFFIASLGNPPPYHATRHSAGHILLKRLQSHLSLPPFSKSKLHAGGLLSEGTHASLPQYTLWQSPGMMNTSGLPLLKAYKTFLSETESDSATPALVILHDEMETQPAQLKLRRGPTSPKGHNGIKSVQQTLSSAGLMDKLSTDNSHRFLKVAVGIGRPSGGTREKDDVSAHVLGQLSSGEKMGIEGCVEKLVQLLDTEMGRISRGL